MIIELIGLTALIVTLPGTIELFLVTAGSLLPMKKERSGFFHPKIAIIVPAHNEEKVIRRTLQSINACSGVFDTYVIADNCTDGTVRIAQEEEVAVLERNDPDRRGKHYALQFAFHRLREDYDWFVVVDADTVVERHLVQEICREIDNGAQAVQVRYAILDPDRSLRHRLTHVAFLAFNGLRPRGRAGWRLSAGILGNGFALSRELIRHVPFDLSSIVEDVAYHIKLIEGGYKVIYTDAAVVYGEMPEKERGMVIQRARWEGGRLRLALDELPWLIKDVRKGRWRLLEPMLDLLLLPLGYHVLFILVALFCGWFDYGVIALGIVAVHTCLAILKYGTFKDFLALLAVPQYLFWKIVRLPNLLFHPDEWRKTER